MSAFVDAGVDLGYLKAFHVGVGDLNHPSPGGTGRFFIDDIRIRVIRPAPADGE